MKSCVGGMTLSLMFMHWSGVRGRELECEVMNCNVRGMCCSLMSSLGRVGHLWMQGMVDRGGGGHGLGVRHLSIQIIYKHMCTSYGNQLSKPRLIRLIVNCQSNCIIGVIMCFIIGM